ALFSALRELGYQVESETGNDKLPVKIFGGRRRREESQTEGESKSLLTSSPTEKKCRVSIDESSQFASALVLSSRTGGWKIEIVGENADESPYVAMTSKLMEVFPWQGGAFQIEPDASSGSYFWAAGRVADSPEFLEYSEQFKIEIKTKILSNVSVVAWPSSGWQMDERFLDFINLRGWLHDFIMHEKSGKLFDSKQIEDLINSGQKGGIISRTSDLGDSIMTAIAITPFEFETIHFTDLGRLRVQECERVVALRTELTKCGAK